MTRTILTTAALAVSLSVPAAWPPKPATPTAKAAFARLKQLAGEWEGTVMTPDGPAVRVKWEPTAGGQVMRETMFPGTSHEMVTMYHLDGPQLVLTHYCAAGNQPRMKLVAFTPWRGEVRLHGGSNLDATKDVHMHAGFMFEGRRPHRDGLDGYVMGKPGQPQVLPEPQEVASPDSVDTPSPALIPGTERKSMILKRAALLRLAVVFAASRRAAPRAVAGHGRRRSKAPSPTSPAACCPGSTVTVRNTATGVVRETTYRRRRPLPRAAAARRAPTR